MDRVKTILRDYHQPALAEEFITGREFTIGIMGNEDLEVLPIEEIIYGPQDKYSVMTEAIKVADSVGIVCPADVEEKDAVRMRDYAKKIYRALECREYARVDVRMDARGKLYFIDLNTLPGLKPDYSDFPNVAEKGGYSYDELILNILDLAWARSQRETAGEESATS
jgi:D-alanine-D-alanine ligase